MTAPIYFLSSSFDTADRFLDGIIVPSYEADDVKGADELTGIQDLDGCTLAKPWLSRYFEISETKRPGIFHIRQKEDGWDILLSEYCEARTKMTELMMKAELFDDEPSLKAMETDESYAEYRMYFRLIREVNGGIGQPVFCVIYNTKDGECHLFSGLKNLLTKNVRYDGYLITTKQDAYTINEEDVFL